MKKEIVIYGASTLGKIAYLTLKEDYYISFFCDGDTNKIGKSIDGIKILGKEELLNKEQLTVVIASMYYREIAEELYFLGINKIKILNITKNVPNLSLKVEPLNIGEYIISDYKTDIGEKIILSTICDKNTIIESKNKKRIVFFSTPNGGDNFLEDIIEQITLMQTYEVKKIIVKNYSQIDEFMEWADICWFEWCDGLIAYASNQELSKYKKIICRLHYYEAFTEIINNVNWNNVDNVIFVSNFIKEKVEEKLKMKNDKKFLVIPNGINLEKFRYLPKEKGYNIAFLATIYLRKNPMMVIQYFYELYKKDNRYNLYLAGEMVDELLKDYLLNIVKTLGIENNVHFDGKIEKKDVQYWFRDKHYIISGGIGEGHPVGIMEGMSCGLKPLIHYFPGIYDFYPIEYVYTSFSEFNNIVAKPYKSYEYRKYIEKNFSLQKQIDAIVNILK